MSTLGILSLLSFGALAVPMPSAVAEEASEGVADHVVPLWPQSSPAWDAPQESERDTTKDDGRTVAGKRVTRLGFVSKPELHVFYPKAKLASQTAVLICPGGGYSILAWDLEGTEIAEWFSNLGVTAIVVKYRVPTRSSDEKWLAPVQDIQRGIAMVRAGEIEGVRAENVGVLGFSAGGNAAIRTALANEQHFETVKGTAEVSVKPDFMIGIYPAWLNEDKSVDLLKELTVTDQSPPGFFAHAADDRVSALSSVAAYTALHQAKVPAELHVFASGGHGFGGRIAGQPTDAWRELCGNWLQSQGWIEGSQ